MLQLHTENIIPLKQVPKHLPRTDRGKCVHLATIYRWALQGMRGIRLETIRVGGSRFTSLEAIQRFAAQVTEKVDGQPEHGTSILQADRKGQANSALIAKNVELILKGRGATKSGGAS